jgi:hypothetical protein
LLHRPDGQEPGGQVVAAHLMKGRCAHLKRIKPGLRLEGVLRHYNIGLGLLRNTKWNLHMLS